MRPDLPPPPRILVIVLQRLGDVLLTTPMIRSLKRAWPDARIDALVYAETAGILLGNPDIEKIVTMPSRPGAFESLSLVARLWRRYDLAISAQAGDRPTFFAVVAGRIRVAPVEQRLSGRIKQLFLQRSISAELRLHRVEKMLKIVEALGVAPVGEVVCPAPRTRSDAPSAPYAVIHAAPMYRYKQWTMDGWRALASALAQRGLKVIATGGPARSEQTYLDAIWGRDNDLIERRDGQLAWDELTALVAGAKVYVGPDTSVTHLAAATGCPTVALYGPTDPVLWGPWPKTGLKHNWAKSGIVQRRDNVWLIQHNVSCVPCQLEGCERNLGSYSRCLDEMPFASVMIAVDEALRVGGDAASRGSAAIRRPV